MFEAQRPTSHDPRKRAPPAPRAGESPAHTTETQPQSQRPDTATASGDAQASVRASQTTSTSPSSATPGLQPSSLPRYMQGGRVAPENQPATQTTSTGPATPTPASGGASAVVSPAGRSTAAQQAEQATATQAPPSIQSAVTQPGGVGSGMPARQQAEQATSTQAGEPIPSAAAQTGGVGSGVSARQPAEQATATQPAVAQAAGMGSVVTPGAARLQQQLAEKAGVKSEAESPLQQAQLHGKKQADQSEKAHDKKPGATPGAPGAKPSAAAPGKEGAASAGKEGAAKAGAALAGAKGGAAKEAAPEAAKAKGVAPAEQANPAIASEAAAGGAASGGHEGPASASGGGGGGGGGAAGGAAAAGTSDAGGGEGAEAAASSSPEGEAAGPAQAVQEKTEEKMAAADPAAAAEEAQAEPESAHATSGGGTEAAEEAAEGGGSAAAEQQSPSEGGAAQAAEAGASEGASEGAEGGAGAEPEAVKPAPVEAATQADPEARQRELATQETREQHADTQRVAEAGSEEHAEDQAEQQADSSAGASAPAEAEMSSGEKGAGMSELGESVGGGGGEGGGAAGGGGGGGGAAPAVEEGTPPDTASQDPAAGLGAAATLSPVQASAALGGVSSSINRTSSEEASALQEQIPQAEVGADGAPPTAVQTLEGGEGGEKPAAVDAPASEATPEPAPLPEAGPAPTESIPTPSVSAGEGGTVTAEDGERVQGAVSDLPTQDPGLDVPAGAPPKVQLTGDADPATAEQQKAELDQTVAAERAQGAVDAAAPAGENAIRVTRPKETIKGPTVADAAAGGAAAAAAAEEGVGIIANEKKGPEVRAAMAQAQSDMAAKKGEHQEKVTEEKTKNNEQMAALKEENLAQQEAEKAGAKREVAKARSDWTAEQKKEVTAVNQKAGKEVAKGNQQVTQEETKANTEANQHIVDGEKEAAEAKDKAERDAAAKKAEAKKESSGVFGWLSSKVSSFFNAIKKGITAIFDAAKKLVRAVIDKAKKLAVAAIEAARKAIVSVIKAVGAALIALGDVFLAAFPGLRKKWRGFIESRVRDAENAVNRLADALKKGVTKLLDALGKAFEFLLDAYKKAMFMVLDAAKAVVDGAIKFAKAAAELLGTFVVLIKDIASNPGGWISNLGAAVMDGVKNHLWKSFKSAIKEWFNAKLEEVLGVGMTIWNVLKKGGITIKEVGHMAFEALKAAIPSALIALLIEKVVAMIVPAAGAVMAIIEGLQAAWSTVQRIIAALGKFVSFLKAVKAGGAGPQFAELLAAAAIVVIDFVANWLIKKLRGPASKVGSKVKAIAQKIMAKVKAAMKKVGGALKKVAKKIGGALKKGKKKFSDWRAKRKAKKDAKGKSASEKKKHDKDAAKEKQLKKKLVAAMKAIKSGLRAGMPEKKARSFAEKTAKRYKAHAALSPSGSKKWQINLSINPKLSAFVPGMSAEDAKAALKKANVTKGSVEAKLTAMMSQISAAKREQAPADAPVGKRQADAAAKQEVQQQVQKEGGLAGFAEQNKADLKSPQSPQKSGQSFEEKSVAAERARAAERGEVLGDAPKRSNQGGLDVGSVDPASGTVKATEVKRGDLKVLSQESSQRGAKEGTTPIPLDPKADAKGSEAARHLQKHPEDAAKINQGAVLTKKRDDGKDVVFENKFSAITSNLLSNLRKLAAEIRASAAKAPEAEKAKIRKAAEDVDKVVQNQGGKLQITVAQLQGKSRPDTEIEALKTLIAELQQRLDNVEISLIIQTLDGEGNIVGKAT